MSQPYADRLGIPVPRVEDHLPGRTVKLFHTMVVALLERGAPMSLDELVARLESAGVRTTHGLRTSLLRAWAGREPVIRNGDGTFGLLIDSGEWDWVLMATDLEPRRPLRGAEPPEPAPRGEDEPLDAGELATFFRARDWARGALTDVRVVASALEVAGRPMTPSELDRFVSEVAGVLRVGVAKRAPLWRARMVDFGSDGVLRLRATEHELRAVRRQVRAVVLRERRAEAQEAQSRAYMEAFNAEREARQARAVLEASRIRRAIVRALPERGTPAAFGVLDVATRAITVWTPVNVRVVHAALGRYDELAGLDVRRLVQSIGADAERWRLADLGPPQRTIRLDRAGRVLRLDAAMLIGATTGIARPLADARVVAGYVRAGATARIVRRLEADLKSLYALYRYGTLHRHVRLRWGFLDEMLHVAWPHAGDRTAEDLLSEVEREGGMVDVVLGAAPGWKDPWARAIRLRPSAHGEGELRAVEVTSGAEIAVTLWDIQAIRWVEVPRTTDSGE
jgi:hypothetical protein